MKVRKISKKSKAQKVELINMDQFPSFFTNGLLPLEKWDTKWKPLKREAWKKKASKYLRIMIACGTGREESKEILGIGEQVYDSVEAYLFERDAMKYCSMSVPQRFYIYVLKMEYATQQLNEYISANRHGDPTKTNIVGAVKAIAQFQKDIIKTGQELNVIDSKAKNVNVIGDINLNVLSTVEIKELLRERMEKFNDVIGTARKLSGPYSKILSKSIKQVDDNEDFLDVEYEEK